VFSYVSSYCDFCVWRDCIVRPFLALALVVMMSVVKHKKPPGAERPSREMDPDRRRHDGGRMARLLTVFVVWAMITLQVRGAPQVQAAGWLRLAPGFRGVVCVPPEAAPDVRAMTLDTRGRLVLSGPGYIKTMLAGEDGSLAGEVPFDTPPWGASGLCFSGADVYVVGGGWLWRYRDADGDARPDGPPTQVMAVGDGEYGAHAIRRGPDGALYLISGFEQGAGLRLKGFGGGGAGPSGGAVLRLGRDGTTAELVCEGLENPFDFAFDAAGELLLCDRGSEGLLPWEAPGRLLHGLSGSHYGWMAKRAHGSLCRPLLGTGRAGFVLDLGPLEPRGMVCYQHQQFPAAFRGGLFVADWASGRVLHIRLEADGTAYRAHPEVFMEIIAPEGFAPTCLLVGTEGSLYVSSGGRRARGGVLRIDYAGPPLLDPVRGATPSPEMNQVLQASQPLEAWSRARWEPLARQVGSAAFLRVAADEGVEPEWRVRAIEVLTDVFEGLPSITASAAGVSRHALVRARTAWSLGRAPGPNPALALLPLLDDAHPGVRCQALEAAARLPGVLSRPEALRGLVGSLGHPDRAVRVAAVVAAAGLPGEVWLRLREIAGRADPGTRLMTCLAGFWRQPQPEAAEVLEELRGLLAETTEAEAQVDALRMMAMALGNWNAARPTLDALAGVEPGRPAPKDPRLLNDLKTNLRKLAVGTGPVGAEAARVLAMIEDKDAGTVRAMLAGCGPRSAPAQDLHVLACVVRMHPWPPDALTKLAEIVAGLAFKLPGSLSCPPAWQPAVGELTRHLLRLEPRLAAAVAAQPRVATPENAWLALQLPPAQALPVARRTAAYVLANPERPCPEAVVDLLAVLRLAEARPALRVLFNQVALRDAVLHQLSAGPEAADAGRFWVGLSSPRMGVIRSCVSALLALPPAARGTNVAACVACLRDWVDFPEQTGLRGQLLTLLRDQTGVSMEIQDRETLGQPLLTRAAATREAWKPLWDWLNRTRPELARQTGYNGGFNAVYWRERLREAPWAAGDAERGRRVAVERGCADCHAAAEPFGPPLEGLAARLGREEIFSAIVHPAHDVEEALRPVTLVTRQGASFTGWIVHDTPQWTLLQTGARTTVRLAGEDLVARLPSRLSFMPYGLLDDLPPQALADLHRFLESLK